MNKFSLCSELKLTSLYACILSLLFGYQVFSPPPPSDCCIYLFIYISADKSIFPLTGKERLFLEVARVLRKKVYVTAAKLHILRCLGFPEEDMRWFTLNEQESHIHVVPMWTIASFKRLKHISNQYVVRSRLLPLSFKRWIQMYTHTHSYVSMYALVHVCIRNISWDPKYNIRFMTLSLSLSPPQVYLFVTDFSRLPAIGNMTILKDWQYKFVYYFAFLILILTLFHEMDIHQYHLYADCPGSIQSYSCFLSHRVDIW